MESTNFDNLGKYVEKIVKLIVHSKDCQKLIDPEEDECFSIEDILLGGDFIKKEYDKDLKKEVSKKVSLQPYVYDYAYTIGTTENSKTYIMIDTSVDSVEDNIFTNITLDIYVATPKEQNRLSKYSIPKKSEMEENGYYGNRVNMLCSAIEKELNNNSEFGISKLMPAQRNYAVPFLPNENYYGKHLRYFVYGYNDTERCDT